MTLGDWISDAACRGMDTESFFLPPHDREARVALRVCAACPVRVDCLQDAYATDAYGVWGGTTERQRGRQTRPLLRVATA